jgi:hypothetical protein
MSALGFVTLIDLTIIPRSSINLMEDEMTALKSLMFTTLPPKPSVNCNVPLIVHIASASDFGPWATSALIMVEVAFVSFRARAL